MKNNTTHLLFIVQQELEKNRMHFESTCNDLQLYTHVILEDLQINSPKCLVYVIDEQYINTTTTDRKKTWGLLQKKSQADLFRPKSNIRLNNKCYLWNGNDENQ